MALTPGARFGPYEVVGSLGAGGMGEVYRARDSKLQRDVALKILPAAFASDDERVARFRREAQVLASLSHPNIAGIYGLEESTETTALVLELVEGPTLADKLSRGPIPLQEALGLARQVADAIESAHERGVIHRDLKPANVKLTADGQVKVLDFGLAKMLESETVRASVSMSPTLSVHATHAGVILGTAAYMSPEQARGKPVDRRADVWAFGCLLYEMLTAARAFPGEDITDIVAAIVRGEPDWSRLPAETPPAIRQLLRRCLEKDPRERLPSIGAARLEIRDALAAADSTIAAAPAPMTRQGRGPGRLAWAVAAFVVLVVAGIVTAWTLRPKPTEALLYRSSLLSPDNVPWAAATPATRFAVSPDGRRLAFLGTGPDGVTRIWVRPLDGLGAQPLAGTEGAVMMFWSFDSRNLAFNAGGKMRTIAVAGGPPITIGDSTANNGGSWNNDDVILFEPTATSGIYRINAAGGTPKDVTTLDVADQEVNHWQPFFLPDGRHFLFHSTASKSHPTGAIYVGSIDGGKPTFLLEGGSNAQYALGHLLFMRGSTLVAQPFDAAHLALRGDAIPIAEQIQTGGSTGRTAAFSVSQTGALVYQAGALSVGSRLTWADRAGKEIGALGEPGDYGDVELSPDGARVAVSLFDPAARGRDIWIYDVKRGLRTRFTFDPGDEFGAVWSPDGAHLLYVVRTSRADDLVQKPSNGSGAAEKIISSPNATPTSWSPDGKWLLLSSNVGGAADIWRLPLSGDRKPTPLMQTPFAEANGRYSPDGRWIAYSSTESGRNQIYVVSALSPQTGKWQVSVESGTFPRWRRDGKELFFVANNNRLMAAAVSSQGSAFEVGELRSLFDVRFRTGLRYTYDVTADGQRFLINSLRDDPSPEPLTLVVNWTAALRRQGGE